MIKNMPDGFFRHKMAAEDKRSKTGKKFDASVYIVEAVNHTSSQCSCDFLQRQHTCENLQ